MVPSVLPDGTPRHAQGEDRNSLCLSPAWRHTGAGRRELEGRDRDGISRGQSATCRHSAACFQTPLSGLTELHSGQQCSVVSNSKQMGLCPTPTRLPAPRLLQGPQKAAGASWVQGGWGSALAGAGVAQSSRHHRAQTVRSTRHLPKKQADPALPRCTPLS